MRFLTLFAACMALSAFAMAALARPSPDVRPKPRPAMDCFVVEDRFVDCRVRK